MFRAKRKQLLFQEGLSHGAPLWCLEPVADDPHTYVGWISLQGRQIRLEARFPNRFPFEEPRFIFPDRNVTHPCVDSETGQMTLIWSETWSPVAAHPNPIMQSLLLVLNQYSVKGKERSN